MPGLNLDIFLNLDGIAGESTVKGHESEITVLSYEQAVDVAIIHSGSGSGAAAGKATFSSVLFRKNVDAASIPMLLACAAGRHINEARFTFRRAGNFDFYKVTLESVLITHIAQRAGTGAQYPLSFEMLNSGASNDGFLDEVTLNYSRIRWEYRAHPSHGGIGPPTAAGGWDVIANKPL